ncbi:hypothetical protein DFH07DRAFT_945483 [Mycena maculata]|uniref:Uncharacterized protein n=1 Tax=Mycena maculata TaxID=230809 RepID=A0AAD7HYQ3_9AGAR|nr:hypothetical protein DFH07DRAFT_945483 [Mycena maculata]
MSVPLNYSPPMDAVPMYRNDSEESADSPFASMLNTPADEQLLHFDSLDGKLLAMATPQALGEITIKAPARRISLSRQFAKAPTKANTSAASQGQLARASEPACAEISHRPQTPEPPIVDTYNTPSPQTITRTTRRTCPPMRRHIFSPPSKPIHLDAGDESVSDFTPRAHSTLRHRKGMYLLPNDSITGEPASEALHVIDLHKPAQEEVDDDALSDDEHDAFTVPALSPLFPLQVVLFPAYAIVVGASILMCPTRLPVIAFPASPSPTSPLHRALAACLPFAAPPSPIRAFAHWAALAPLHVAIFLAALIGIAYMCLPLGALLAAGAATQFVRAWGDFGGCEEGGRGEVLGGEVRQMLYQVLMCAEYGFHDGDTLKREGERYFVVRAPRRKETRAEILVAGGAGEEYDEDEQ